MSSYRVTPAASLQGSLSVPGDKSISHRALLLAALAGGECRIENAAVSQDVRSTAAVLRQLGVGVDVPDVQLQGTTSFDEGLGAPAYRITVEVDPWASPANPLNCGNSGTTMRCLMGALAGQPLNVVLVGDDSLSLRPMERVASPLRQMGARISTEQGHAPVAIVGADLHGVHLTETVRSAQVKTAILLAALRASGQTSFAEVPGARDHTERMLQYLKCFIDKAGDSFIVRPTSLQGVPEISVPGDISSAAFHLVGAAIMPGSDVRVLDCGLNPTRTGVLDLLTRFGARVEISREQVRCNEPLGEIRVRPDDRRPVHVGADEIPRIIDELPLVAVLGAFADGETVVSGASELRVKESDRIATICDGLTRMGVEIEQRPDGFVVHGRGGTSVKGGTVESFGDHRIAMALAVAGLSASGSSVINGWEAVAVSYPEFERDLSSLVIPA